jgi:integrase
MQEAREKLMKLTDLSVRALAPPERGQRLYYDDSLPSFGCRVSQGGTKSFFLQLGRDRQFITIGRYHPDILPLAKARNEAKRLLAERTLGKFRPQSMQWDAAVDLFLSICEQKNKARTTKDYRRLLKRHFPFKTTRLPDITPQHINRRIDRLAKTTSEQNHALVAVKVFLRWCQRRHYIQHSPCEGMQTIKRPSRTRILSDPELAAIYRTAAELGTPFALIVQLCLLTGQRRTEVAWLRHSYIADDLLTLPDSLTKNRRVHVMPLGPIASKLIKSIPDADDLLFPAQRGDGVFGGWGKQKTAFDKALKDRDHKLQPWVLHDLRRTFRTKLGRLGVAPHVAERLVNHISAQSEMEKIYDQYKYLPEMRQAIELWEGHLVELITAK